MLVFGEGGWKQDDQEFLVIFVWLVQSQPGLYGVGLKNNVKQTKAKPLKVLSAFPLQVKILNWDKDFFVHFRSQYIF